MSCEEARSKLNELADRELDPAAEAGLREHLAACAGCRQLHEDLERLKTLVRAKFRKPVPRATFQCSCLARAYAGEGRVRVRRMRVLAAGLLLGAIAASLFLLLRPAAPILNHAEASSACALAFRQARQTLASRQSFPVPQEDWRATIADDIRSATGVSIDRLPEIPNACYAGWHPETVKGLKGVRIDFCPVQRSGTEAAAGEPPSPPPGCRDLISLFYFPLSNMKFTEGYLKKLEQGHRCTRCIAMKDGSILCFRSADFLISVVSNLGEEELVARHFPR